MSVFSVLCIEDNEANMLVLERILASNAFTIFKATTAEEGLELAQTHKPDLILMDIGLPGMDGLSATRLLKSDSTMRHIPIIAVTASAVHGPEECYRAGCDGYVSKPVTLTKLMTVLLQYTR